LNKKFLVSHPLPVTIISAIGSALVYIPIALAVGITDFYTGLGMSVAIPLLVAYPVTHFTRRNLLRIEEQNRKLAQLDTENKKLFSLLSHDLRSPIASLKGVVDLMVDQELDAESSKAMLKEVSLKTETLLSFLNDILHWSKDQMELRKSNPVLFDASEVIKQVVDLYEEKFTGKAITLNFRPSSVQVWADKDAYAFIVRNLIQNALKFTEKGGRIDVAVELTSDGVNTRIQDSGKGITEEDLKKIQNKDLWFSTEGNDGEKGTGFGINTCINFAHDNGGELIIESEYGVGTSVILQLPAKPQNY
jgi:signal transduction histidine kinase